MTDIQHLNNPPINEALLDIRLELAKNFDNKKLESIYDSVKDTFPVKQASNKWETLLELKPGENPVAKSEGGENGFWFKSADSTKILQLRTDGFTLNKLKPYESWESLVTEAKQYWNIYQKVVGEHKINRLALRYINSIQVPISASIADYIIFIPTIPEDMRSNVPEFFTRFVIDDAKSDSKANIILALDNLKSTDQEKTFIFDVDAYRNVNNPKSEQIWEIFESLHNFKNTIFFNGITNKALEKYK
jgi:uncharacterized protein (TIGR04255 family)